MSADVDRRRKINTAWRTAVDWTSVGDVMHRLTETRPAVVQAAKRLTTAGVLEHNGKATKASRYRLKVAGPFPRTITTNVTTVGAGDVDPLTDRILRTLAPAPLKARQIAHALIVTVSDVDRALARLAEDGLVHRSSLGTWRLVS